VKWNDEYKVLLRSEQGIVAQSRVEKDRRGGGRNTHNRSKELSELEVFGQRSCRKKKSSLITGLLE